MKRVLILLVISAVKAQIPNLGFCPDYLPMSDFDIDRFLGKWYEAERYFQFSEVVARCVVTDYAKAPSGRIYVSNEVTNRLTGVKRVIGGNLELAGRAGEGKLHVKYATTPLSTDTVLTVLDTDYDTYAVIWSCSGLGPIHAQSAWVMTRDRLPNGNVLQRAYGVLDKYRISRTFFVKTDQEGCALAASDINAANGITSTSTIAEATGSEQKTLNDEGSSQKEEKSIGEESNVQKQKVDANQAAQNQLPIVNKDEILPVSKPYEPSELPPKPLIQDNKKYIEDQTAVENQSSAQLVPQDQVQKVENKKSEEIKTQRVLTVAEVVLENQKSPPINDSSVKVQDQVVEEAQVVQVANSPDELIPDEKRTSSIKKI